MSAKLEHMILSGLFHRPEFARRTLPYLKPHFFKDAIERVVFDKVATFTNTYNASPTKEAVEVEIDSDTALNDETFRSAIQLVDGVCKLKDATDLEWLVSATENWAKDAAVEHAILESIRIIQGKDKKRTRGMIPQMLTEALAVSFDPNVGVELLGADYRERWKHYHEQLAERIPTDLHILNRQLGGGFAKGTLNVLMGQTNLGKSLAMCSLSSGMLAEGRRVLYASAEMSTYEIVKRIEANLLDTTLDDLKIMPVDEYETRMRQLENRITGQFVVHQFPTGAASVTDIRNLLDELRIKRNFVPDVICADYINIFRSSRVATDNSYMLIKAIAEEFRGLAIERKLCMISATQVRRDAFDAALLSLKDVPESKALVDTVDWLGGLSIPPEFKHQNYILIQTLKTRYGDSTQSDTFAVEINRGKQRLSDLDHQPMIVQERELTGPPVRQKKAEGSVKRSRRLGE